MDYKKKWMKKNSHRKLLLILCTFLLIALTVIVLNIYLQVLQYNEVGNHSSVYGKNLMVQVMWCFVAGVISFIAFFVSGIFARRNSIEYFRKTGVSFGKFPVVIPAIAAGVITALLAKDLIYREALLFFNSVSFNKVDPVFGRDIAYYIFQRPFLLSVHHYLFNLWIVLTTYIAGFYLVVFATTFSNFSFKYLKIDSVLTHNLINAGVFFVLLALSFPLKREDFLFLNLTDSLGESFIQANVWVPYYTVMTFALPLLVILAFYYFKNNKLKKAVITFSVIPFLWATVMVISFVLKETVVKPNELVMESPYIRYNIQMTRQAYGIDHMTIVENQEVLPPEKEVVYENVVAFSNVPIMDEASVLSFDLLQQSESSFYTFNDIDVTNVQVNGKSTLVYIAVREINHATLPDKSYMNTKYRYTHGYGLVMSSVNSVNEKGEPEYILRYLSGQSKDPGLSVTVPEIYYGELTHDYAIVNAAGINEIDYAGTRESRYTGAGGIHLNFLNRLLFAVKYGDMKLLSSGFAKNATLLTNRQIIARAQLAAPFLEIDKDPYPMIDDQGRIKWILDAYTYSDQYPYSRYINGINYIRPSVKVVIDAYDGNVEYHIIDKEDPVIRAYEKIYPKLFETGSLPVELSKHMKYPESLFKIQSDLLRRYHLSEDQTESFYTQNELWAIAKTSAETSTGGLKDRSVDYVFAKLPSSQKDSPESVMMRVYTTAENRHDMRSFLTVGNDFANYGKLTLVHFPRNGFTLGPYQIEKKIDQIDLLSEKKNRLGQSGSFVSTGSTILLPMGRHILYITPVYINASGMSGTPKILDVVAGYQLENDFVYGIGKNLSEALENLLNKNPEEISEEKDRQNDAKVNDLMNQLNDLKKQLEDLQTLIENLYNDDSGSGQAD